MSVARLEITCWEPSAAWILNLCTKVVKKGSPRGHLIVQVGNIMYYFLDDNAHGESGEHVRRPICSQYGFRLLLYSPALPPLPLHRYNTSTASIKGQCTMCIGVFILIVNFPAVVTPWYNYTTWIPFAQIQCKKSFYFLSFYFSYYYVVSMMWFPWHPLTFNRTDHCLWFARKYTKAIYFSCLFLFSFSIFLF